MENKTPRGLLERLKRIIEAICEGRTDTEINQETGQNIETIQKIREILKAGEAKGYTPESLTTYIEAALKTRKV
jgi:uncharacterized protein YerC